MGLYALGCGLCVLGLSACMGMNPVIDTALRAVGEQPAAPQFVPGVAYLHITVNGRQAWMALGERTQDTQGVHTYWYSGQGEMLHLRNGRLVEALGLTHELRGQRGVAPSWDAVAQSPQGVQWQHQRDWMPGYRYGVWANISSQTTVPTPQQEQLVGPGAQWFVDRVHTQMAQAQAWHYLERFAVRDQQVVYSEQCLAPQLCLTLRHVGVVKP